MRAWEQKLHKTEPTESFGTEDRLKNASQLIALT